MTTTTDTRNTRNLYRYRQRKTRWLHDWSDRLRSSRTIDEFEPIKVAKSLKAAQERSQRLTDLFSYAIVGLAASYLAVHLVVWAVRSF